ncbi:MAG: hypothetical protein KJ069_11950 [Anaerolineae bacterium]|nr:hypothetical protein [Anaerolineae bacterium]
MFSIGIVACSEEPETVEVTRIVEVPVEVDVPAETVEVEVPVEVTRVVEVIVEPEAPASAVSTVPFEEQWANSPHADAEAEAFIHWNEEDPAEVPANCAKCHSTTGFMDFVGADGSAFGSVEVAAPIGQVIECQACHNDATLELSSVTFPSGVEVTGLGPEARCMTCHQGRASTVSVNQGFVDAGLDPVADLDTVSEEVGFSNIHYYPAAATQYGTVAMGGYEYEGKTYDAKFDHVAGMDTCVDCHSPHTLEVQFEKCTACHEGLNGVEDLANIRMFGSLVDYNGNGDIEEGIMAEIAGLQDALYQAMQAYANEVTGTPIVYDSASYPYFFADTDGSGAVSEGDERFATWTPRLAKAAYNYQMSQKDPGEFAHGGKYTIQLLYDSIEDLNLALSTPVDMSAMTRVDMGHFAGSEEPFRHWDEEGGVVPGSCSKCHSAAGLPLFVEQGVSINQPASNGLNCATCHNDLTTFTRYAVEEVEFPSGATLTLAEAEDDAEGLESNLCINCHQGRSSTTSVDRALSDLPGDEVSDGIRFQNIHYFAAGATLFGNDAQGAYQFADKEYLGRNEHVNRFDSCVECHDTHALEVVVEECSECHENVASADDLVNIRDEDNTTDYDGDGDVTEGMAGEIATFSEALYAAMQAYSASTPGALPILYNASAYPYFFGDADGNGEVNGEEAGYNTFTPNLLRAAYNYQYVQKDPGAFAHNGKYVLQFLYDSIEAVGGDTSGLTRP